MSDHRIGMTGVWESFAGKETEESKFIAMILLISPNIHLRRTLQ